MFKKTRIKFYLPGDSNLQNLERFSSNYTSTCCDLFASSMNVNQLQNSSFFRRQTESPNKTSNYTIRMCSTKALMKNSFTCQDYRNELKFTMSQCHHVQ